MSSLDLLKSVGLAGAFATIVASWATIKNVFSQVSAVLITQTKLDHTTTHIVRAYLKKHWHRLPSGINSYVGIWMTHRDNDRKLTPFRALSKSEIFYKNGSFVLIKFESNETSIYSIRGFFKPEKFLSEAISIRHKECSELESKHSNYMVITKRGTAGSFLGMNGRGGRDLDAPVQATGNDSINTTHDYIDVSFQTSFLYDRSEYNFHSDVDPLENFFYSDDVYEYIEEAKRWMNSKDWYMQRSIPWRRGWLVHGPGGTGKSKFASVIAQILNIKVYNMVLSTMTDLEFMSTWEELEFPCVVLFDDFDTVFNKRENITVHKSLSYETVLQTISGIKPSDGVFLFITTNHIDKIDEAMGVSFNGTGMSTRPGRIDRIIYMGACDIKVRTKLVQKILVDWPFMWDEVIAITHNYTVMQVIETCREKAFHQMEVQEFGSSLQPNHQQNVRYLHHR